MDEDVTPPSVQSIRKIRLVPVAFATHALVGTAMFLIIAGVAVGLDLLVHWLETTSTSGWILFGLRTAEAGLFLTDICMFGNFLLAALKRTMKDTEF